MRLPSFDRGLHRLLAGVLEKSDEEGRSWLDSTAADPALVTEVVRRLAEEEDDFLADPALRVLRRTNLRRG